MIEEGSLPAIQDWLIKKLEPISDAEPSVLATYIIALLNKEDKTLDEIRNTCTDQLTDFLKSDTLPFVDSLFQVIKQEDGKILFDSGAGRISKAESFQDSDSDSDRDYRRRDKRRSEESSRSPPRRRGRDDRSYSSSRSSSNSRRSPDRKRSRQYKKPCRDYEEKGFCYRGENCPYDHGDDRIVVNSQDSNRDYNEYVVPFPTSSIPVATFTNTGPMMPPMGMMGIPMNMGVPMMPPMQTIAPIFNPNSSDNDTIVQVGGKGMYNKRERSERPDRSERHDRHERNDRGDRGERNERGDRGERKNKFGSVNNTIVISNIPDSVNGIDSLNSYFKTFGNIINIQVKFGQQKALVQFAKREDATKALQSTLTSPFDHPNIKISWAKKFDRQDNDNGPSNNNNTPTPPPVTPKPDPSTYVAPIATKTTSTSHKAIFNVNASSTTPAIISDKKEEAKKQVKERSSKTIEESKQSLEQAKKLLLTLDTAKIDPQEKAALMKKIADLTESIHTSIAKESTVLEKVKESENIKKIVKKPKLVPNTVTIQDKQRLEKERLDKELEAITTSPPPPPTTTTTTPSDTSTSSDTSTTSATTTTTAVNTSNIERLQQKYATLKKMAASLGYTEPSSAPVGRGRGRGRGGMATAPPRKSMTLDNRTSTLKLDKLPENLRSKDAIQNHFKNFEIKSIELGDSGDTALVQFANRKTAELAVVKAKVHENVNLSMQWHTVKPSNNTNFEDAQEKVQVYQPRTEEEEEEEEEDDDSDSWKRKR